MELNEFRPPNSSATLLSLSFFYEAKPALIVTWCSQWPRCTAPSQSPAPVAAHRPRWSGSPARGVCTVYSVYTVYTVHWTGFLSRSMVYMTDLEEMVDQLLDALVPFEADLSRGTGTDATQGNLLNDMLLGGQNFRIEEWQNSKRVPSSSPQWTLPSMWS